MRIMALIFWKQFIVKHPHKEKDILRAIEIVRSMKVNDYQLSQEEKDKLLLKIHEKHHSILRKRKIQRFTWGAIAACITIIVAFLYWMNRGKHSFLTLEDHSKVKKQNAGRAYYLLACFNCFYPESTISQIPYTD